MSHSRIQALKISSANTQAQVETRGMRMKIKAGVQPKKIPIYLTGGIGDTIVALQTVNQIAQMCGPVEIYCSHPEVARIYSDHTVYHSNDMKSYTYLIWICTMANFILAENFESFENDALEEMFIKNRMVISSDRWKTFITTHPHTDNHMADHCVKMGLDRYTVANYMMGLPSYGTLSKKIQPFFVTYKKTITVHDGIDNNNPLPEGGRATKTWSMEQWGTLTSMIKKEFPDFHIVQLGGKNSRKIPNVDVCLVNQTGLHRSLAILQASSLHIDGDSGLVHAAHVMGVPSVVMFGPTPVKFFGYPENYNISSSFCTDCFWTSDHWNVKCPLDYGTPKCMDSISPEEVLSKVRRALKYEKNKPDPIGTAPRSLSEEFA